MTGILLFSLKNEFGEGTNVNMIDGGVFANNPAICLKALNSSDHLETTKGGQIMKPRV